MASDAIITVENLGKRYRLGAQSNAQYTALRDVLSEKAKSLLGWNGRPPDPDPKSSGSVSQDFWALKDVSFEVMRGDVLGIVGRNGAGKSTLLKILSRITEPTEGKIKIKGRVASLLEVGTGFHPELTGRENIFLNGAILGMHRHEIRSKFDEIVAFAEVERFLDTPVKRYSSGMYVRLAFAVAAHLDPEILVVDEVLAVGDAEFQRKCLGKMKSVAAGEGRTVLFVSHNMAAVGQLCDTGVLLDAGRAKSFDSIAQCVGEYIGARGARTIQLGRGFKHLRSVELQVPSSEQSNDSVMFGDPLTLTIALDELPLNAPIGVNVSIKSKEGILLSLFSTNPHDGIELPRETSLTVRFKLESCCYAPGRFSIDVAVTEPGFRVIEEAETAVMFDVQPHARGGAWPYDERFGSFFPKHDWTIHA